MKWFIALTFLVFNYQIFSQSISRQVIGSTGHIGNNSVIKSSTVGPSNLFTSSFSDNTVLTQGFQQPVSSLLEVEIVVSEPSCTDYNSGSIELIITGCTSEVAINWSTGETSESIENLAPGSYSFTVTSGSCVYENQVELELDADCDSGTPNVITPNADGENDTWVLPQFYSSPVLENKVVIFNRWGQIVWSVNGYDNISNVWKGLNNDGEELPAGTYFFTVETGGNIESGYVELIR